MIDPAGHRKRIARSRSNRGPMHGETAAAELGLTLPRWWAAVCCPWFEIATGGWRLTSRGRAEAFDADEVLT